MQPKFVNLRFNNQKAKNRFVVFISKNLLNLDTVLSAGFILVVAAMLTLFRFPDSTKAAGETVQHTSTFGSILESVGQT
jgi:hypothetical protein